MKFKQLEWVDHERVSYNADNTPQMAYFIRFGWNEAESAVTRRVEFIHGYVPAAAGRGYTELVGSFPDLDTAKVAAQTHFEQYITSHYLTE